eukprot:129245_1
MKQEWLNNDYFPIEQVLYDSLYTKSAILANTKKNKSSYNLTSGEILCIKMYTDTDELQKQFRIAFRTNSGRRRRSQFIHWVTNFHIIFIKVEIANQLYSFITNVILYHGINSSFDTYSLQKIVQQWYGLLLTTPDIITAASLAGDSGILLLVDKEMNNQNISAIDIAWISFYNEEEILLCNPKLIVQRCTLYIRDCLQNNVNDLSELQNSLQHLHPVITNAVLESFISLYHDCSKVEIFGLCSMMLRFSYSLLAIILSNIKTLNINISVKELCCMIWLELITNSNIEKMSIIKLRKICESIEGEQIPGKLLLEYANNNILKLITEKIKHVEWKKYIESYIIASLIKQKPAILFAHKELADKEQIQKFVAIMSMYDKIMNSNDDEKHQNEHDEHYYSNNSEKKMVKNAFNLNDLRELFDFIDNEMNMSQLLDISFDIKRKNIENSDQITKDYQCKLKYRCSILNNHITNRNRLLSQNEKRPYSMTQQNYSKMELLDLMHIRLFHNELIRNGLIRNFRNRDDNTLVFDSKFEADKLLIDQFTNANSLQCLKLFCEKEEYDSEAIYDDLWSVTVDDEQSNIFCCFVNTIKQQTDQYYRLKEFISNYTINPPNELFTDKLDSNKTLMVFSLFVESEEYDTDAIYNDMYPDNDDQSNIYDYFKNNKKCKMNEYGILKEDIAHHTINPFDENECRRHLAELDFGVHVSHWDVSAQFSDMKEEWLKNEYFPIQQEVIDNINTKSKIIANQRRNKSSYNLTSDDILCIKMYTDTNKLQSNFRRAFRADANKNRRSQFIHWATNFHIVYIKIEMANQLHQCNASIHNVTLYHGLNSLFGTKKLIRQFHGALSTTIEDSVAATFAGASGMILQIDTKINNNNMNGIEVDWISCHDIEKEVLLLNPKVMIQKSMIF